MSELKPCPFCGGEAELNIQEIEPHWMSASIICTKCYIQMVRAADTEEEAIDGIKRDWNTRYKSTCKCEAVTNPYGEITEYMCECGRCMGVVPKYCPSCGSLVERVD